MRKLQKITLAHVAVEDRLLLTGIDADGERLRMWLTQRLLLRVLPVHFKALGMHSPGQAPVPATRHEPLALDADLVQGFAQQRARMNSQPAPPVTAAPDSPVFLIHKVDVAAIRGGVVLTFVGEAESDKARLAMTGDSVRHWINGLHDVCVKAQWPLSGFPDWVLEAAQAPASPGAGAAVH